VLAVAGRCRGNGRPAQVSRRFSAHGFPAHGAGVGEVEIFHSNGVDTVTAGVTNESGDRVPDLGIPTGRRPRQVDVDALGWADRVAMLIEAAEREVSVVEIHPHHGTVG
jgi:hypothetical protein